jgi:poly(A) polymerase
MIHAAWLHWPQTQQLIAAFAPYPDALRFVGGAVRDTLLGREVHDVDCATALLPDTVMELLKNAGIHAIPTGIVHGTVTAVIDGKHFEITTLRNDVACDGRHAKVEFTDDWKADAARRDFTMNALYLTPVGEVFDYVAGASDAKAGRVVFIGDARLRIAEDYLRILRFFRFHAHYGKGAPDPSAVTACAHAANHLSSLSGERIAHELLRLLMADNAHEVIQHIAIFSCALGIQIEMIEVLRTLERQSKHISPLVKLAAILLSADDAMDACEAVCVRLKLSNAQVKYLRHMLIEQRSLHADVTLAQQKSLLRRVGAEVYQAAVLLAAARLDNAYMLTMRDLAEQWNPPVFPITGNDLLALGITPEKSLGALLEKLEQQWELSDYTLTKAALLQKIS